MGSDNDLSAKIRERFDFNPRSPHGERLDSLPTLSAQFIISIHAPRMGSDIPKSMIYLRHEISIHAPRMGSDLATVRAFA